MASSAARCVAVGDFRDQGARARPALGACATRPGHAMNYDACRARGNNQPTWLATSQADQITLNRLASP
eukprot:scaffold4010_cov98-Phaeocystis_antarctica.AAC.10